MIANILGDFLHGGPKLLVCFTIVVTTVTMYLDRKFHK